MRFAKIENVRALRNSMGLNQSDFWSAVGVKQSAGSRYESGREMPRQTAELVRIVHIEKIALDDIKRENMILAKYGDTK